MKQLPPPSEPVLLDAEETAYYVDFALHLAEAAGRVILTHFRAIAEVENKAGEGGYDPVTVADREAERVIRAQITESFPDHGVLGEEFGFAEGSAGLTWVIDPIDGTRSFMTGQLHWGTLIALFDGQRPVVGVMAQPYSAEYFTGSSLGAFVKRGRDSRAMRTRPCDDLGAAVLCSTDPAMFGDESDRRAFEALSAQVRMTRFGGDCYSYCMLAHGLVDLVVEADLKAYDIQALVPIIEGAGGVVTDWSGGSPAFGGRVVAAGDRALHARALDLLLEVAG